MAKRATRLPAGNAPIHSGETPMQPSLRLAVFVALSVFLLLGPTQAIAQAGGNRGSRDPAQFMARIMERYRQQFEVKNDEEWKLIQDRIEKVVQAQRELRIGGFGGGRRGANTNSNPADEGTANRGRPNRSNRPNVERDPDVDDLQKALDSKAPASEIKDKLARIREKLKQREANLAKAQDQLRGVLSVRQEAVAVLNGLLR
jgi:hypothetical protein